MPFKSVAQRNFLWANHPDIARRWTEEHGSKVTTRKPATGINNIRKSAKPTTAINKIRSRGLSPSQKTLRRNAYKKLSAHAQLSKR